MPVIQGRAAVVTMATFLPGSRRLLVSPPFLLRLRLGACCCRQARGESALAVVGTQKALQSTDAAESNLLCILILHATWASTIL